MNTVRHLLRREYGASDFESTAAAAAAVTLVDAPCLAGAMALNRHMGRFFLNAEEGEEEEEEDNNALSKIGAAMACMIYPLLVCPTTCWLRRRVVHEAGVEDESVWKTGQIAMCCWPCGLVQMEVRTMNQYVFCGLILFLLCLLWHKTCHISSRREAQW